MKVTDEQIKTAVDRFLAWRLPEHFQPDGGVSFAPPERRDYWPFGTNLFDAEQAERMIRHILEAPKQMDRDEALRHINSLWPPGESEGPGDDTRDIGNRLLIQAIERTGGWPNLPDEVLIELANISIDHDAA